MRVLKCDLSWFFRFAGWEEVGDGSYKGMSTGAKVCREGEYGTGECRRGEGDGVEGRGVILDSWVLNCSPIYTGNVSALLTVSLPLVGVSYQLTDGLRVSQVNPVFDGNTVRAKINSLLMH